jgi:type IV/VI secretion system ImpK/VasF family protein
MMNKELWSIIVTINASLNPLREAVSLDTIATMDLVKLRSKLRAQLEQLRTAIIERYSERDAYLVLFPLTAHCDELVKKMILDINQLEWPPLQQELYQVVDAGDLFYELLDNALAKPDTLPLVYEVYYFCLNDGFCGRHGDNVEKLSDQLKKLRTHIILQPIVTITPPTPAPKKWANFRMLNRIYYGGVVLLLLLIYCFLTFLASTWHPTV